MSKDNLELREKLSEAIKIGDVDQAATLTSELLVSGVDSIEIVQKIIVPTMTVVGEQFQKFEIYLPELMMAGMAGDKVTAIIDEEMRDSGRVSTPIGSVVLGTVQGDLHDIGRNIVGMMLKAHGFNVVDLGRDVRPSAFLETAKSELADIVALSSLLTTTLPAQRSTVNLFVEVGERQNFKIVIGGGAATQEWSDEIGADGYAPDAVSAVDLCKLLLDSN